MNILIVNAGRGWGGIESHSVVLASDLAGKGHRVIVACTPEGNVRSNLNPAVPVADLEVVNAGDLPAIIKLAGIIRRESIEVVLANSGKEYWPAAVAATLLGKKIVFVRHQTDRIRASTRMLINSRIDRVVAVSGAVQRALLQSGIEEEKITVVHNGVSLNRFDPSRIEGSEVRHELGIVADDIVIGTVGKLHEGKGVYHLLRAAAGIAEKRPVTLLFVGDGPEKEGIRREAGRLGLAERIVITGIRRDVERMYAAMDVFVLASTCDEAFGMVIIEAMAMARPVVATRTGGIPELISQGKNGLLVPPADTAALRSAICSLLDDPEYARKIVQAGRKTVEDTFSEEALGKGFERLLLSL